jgi:phosphoesterase RecJ-like protein
MNEKAAFDADDDWSRALGILTGAQRFLLVGHERPDGDCIGAQAALARVLEARGKQVVILNPGDPGPRYSELLEACPFQVHGKNGVPEHEVLVLLDANELSRCGAMAPALLAADSRKLVIDHHPPPMVRWWDAAFFDAGASASGLIVWRIAGELGHEPDPVFDRGVFTALATDTGWFKHSNTDSETMSVVAEIIGRGLDPSEVYAAVYQRFEADQPRAVAGVLARLEYFADGRLAVVDEPRGGASVADTDPVLDILRSVRGVDVVLYVKEMEGGECKLSARSKTGFDVNALARRFGGGGHAKAAGATIPGTREEVRDRIVRAAIEELG